MKPSGTSPGDGDAELDVDTAGWNASHPQDKLLLPLVPSVAILFRCCDILVMLSDQYGFIRWRDILSRIPRNGNITTIYVLTEAAGYSNCRYFAACQQISKTLALLLSEKYPSGQWVALFYCLPSPCPLLLLPVLSVLSYRRSNHLTLFPAPVTPLIPPY